MTDGRADGSVKCSGMYCRKCGYPLHSLAESRCPECGRPFDPGRPWTYRRVPRSKVAGRVGRLLAVSFLCSFALATMAWGWLYVEWCGEQRVLGAIVVAGGRVHEMGIGPRWLRKTLGDRSGALGFVFYRVHRIVLSADVGQASLAGATRLSSLLLVGPGVTDRSLALAGTSPSVEEVMVVGARISDSGLRHLQKMPALRRLDLRDVPITAPGPG